MMNDLQKMDGEKSVLRWGGLAGILGGIVFILMMVILLVLASDPNASPEELLMNFPNDRATTYLGESLYLVALILSVTLFLALYRALRGTSLAPALFGTGVAFLGFAVLGAGALPNLAFAQIADLYHAPGVTPGEQTALIPLWQATQGIFYETDTVGFFFLMVGLIVLGLGMLRAPAFGMGFGGVSVVIGVIGIVAIYVVGLGSLSFAAVVVLTNVIFPLIFGWKVYRLSKAA
jgi:hypothetical protein